jgi:hypothetical protein
VRAFSAAAQSDQGSERDRPATTRNKPACRAGFNGGGNSCSPPATEDVIAEAGLVVPLCRCSVSELALRFSFSGQHQVGDVAVALDLAGVGETGGANLFRSGRVFPSAPFSGSG